MNKEQRELWMKIQMIIFDAYSEGHMYGLTGESKYIYSEKAQENIDRVLGLITGADYA